MTTSMNERTHFFIKIYFSHFILERGCFLCVRGELETGKDCYILTPSSSDHSSTSFAFWLGCSTVGHWGPKPSVWSWFSLRWHPISNWNWNWLKLSVAPGYVIVSCPPASCECTHLPPSPNSTMSTSQGDIPISSTGCTCFAVLPLIYTGASLDWRRGWGSIFYTITMLFSDFKSYCWKTINNCLSLRRGRVPEFISVSFISVLWIVQIDTFTHVLWTERRVSWLATTQYSLLTLVGI